MKIGALFAVFIYTILAIFVSVVLIFLGLGYIPEPLVHKWVSLLYTNPEYQLYLLIAAISLLVISFIFFRISFSVPRKERQILFKGDSGEVMISLSSPIETVVKEIASQLKEVVDIKQEAYMYKKTLIIELKVVMLPGIKLKEISEKLQEMLINRIREVIGLDTPIKVKVRVIKVSNPRRDSMVDEESVPIPFRNMDV